jgi:hypothetical protein
MAQSTKDRSMEYAEWVVLAVDKDTLKAVFRQTCVENGLDLEQVYKD